MTSEVLKKGAENDCIFCKIVAGQIKASVVLETPQVLAFKDISPKAPVHILVIPKKHVERVSELSDADMPLLIEIHKAALKVAQQLNVVQSGFRLVTNNGKAAGQMVDHLHYHLLGGHSLTWPAH